MSIEIEAGTIDAEKPWILFDSIYEYGTISGVGSVTTDGARENAIEDSTFDFWEPTGVPASIQVDYGSNVECDCAAIAAHTAGTEGATLELQSSGDALAWTVRANQSPLDDSTIIFTFPAVTARYWRIVMSGAVCLIGVVKLGKALIVDGGVMSGHVAVNHAARVDLLSSVSIQGQFLPTRVKSRGAETSIDFGMMDVDFVDNDMALFEAHFNDGRTFFYAGSPSIWPNDYGYCRRAGSEMRPSYEEGGTLANVSLEVNVYVER